MPRYTTVTMQIPAIFWHRDWAWEEERTNTRQRLQSFQTLELGNQRRREASGGTGERLRLRVPRWLEPVAALAVSNVEVVPDDRKHHGVFAIQEAAVLDGLVADFRQDVGRPPSVPAQSMPGLWLHTGLRTTDYGLRRLIFGRRSTPGRYGFSGT